jgi:ornithine cyclodeaminase/alanine dehydrogenase-like protein (mu-crystallin family)
LKTTIYSLEDVQTIVRRIGLDRIMDEVIAALFDCCKAYDPATAAVPVREGFEYSEPEPGLIEWMPAMQYGSDVTIKIVGYHPHNPAREKLPTILSTVLTFDTQNGHLVSVIDGNLITAIRTGASSAVASRILAEPGAATVGLIGAGAQALSQLHALSREFEIHEVLVHDVNSSALASFPGRAACLGLRQARIRAADLEQVVSRADILCTATSVPVGAGPVFEDEDLKTSVHINAVGSDFPGKVEIPHSVLTRSLVCPDFRPQAVREGECQQLGGDGIGPDLVELVKGSDFYAGYRDRGTVYDSTGWAMQDYVTAKLFSDYGRELGCGTELSLANVTRDPLNPYASLGTLRGLARDGS